MQRMIGQETSSNTPRVGLIGFGEAGAGFARAADWQGSAAGWDVLEERRALMAECGVKAAENSQNALADAQCVLSLVTADKAVAVARDYAPDLAKGALWIDMNSVAPATKQAASEAILSAGGQYADVAVMAPVDKKLAVPLLISGPDAERALDYLTALGFTNIRIVGENIGQASAIKLCRSVMVKGLEALTAEMVTAASSAGVLDEVLSSLDASDKQISWFERADYNFDRMMIHGERRSAEMAEAVTMLRDLGLEPRMSEQTVAWQQSLGQLKISPPPAELSAKLTAIKDKCD